MDKIFPASLLAALADLVKWLEHAKIPSMVIGGVAASFLGKPRMTQDVDALAILPEHDWDAALAAAAKYGIVPRIEQPLEFARRTRILLLRHAPSEIDIDVAFGGLPFEHEAIGRSQIHRIEGIRVRLPKVEDLLVMKAVALRPKDLLDIQSLLETHPGADVEIVRRWVREFAMATSRSDILEEFEKQLARRKPAEVAKKKPGSKSESKSGTQSKRKKTR